MKIPEDDIQRFNDSLDRCIANPDFMDLFYDEFIVSSPEVAALFASTPMKRQKRHLKASLFTALLAADGNDPAREHLSRLAHRHRELDILPQHYELWLECLIAAAKRCGGAFDDKVELAWRSVLSVAVELVRNGT